MGAGKKCVAYPASPPPIAFQVAKQDQAVCVLLMRYSGSAHHRGQIGRQIMSFLSEQSFFCPIRHGKFLETVQSLRVYEDVSRNRITDPPSGQRMPGDRRAEWESALRNPGVIQDKMNHPDTDPGKAQDKETISLTPMAESPDLSQTPLSTPLPRPFLQGSLRACGHGRESGAPGPDARSGRI